MKKPKTYVAIILDKSGSMASTKEATISGFNEQVQQLKMDAKDQEILCSLITFDGEVYEHLWMVPADQLGEANPDNYIPNGGTAMRDAVGYTVQKFLDTTNPNEEVSYLIKIISDGETNADKHYTPAVLKELVQGVEASKKWTFTYMGCSAAYMEEVARQTGTNVANMAAWSNNNAKSAKTAFANDVLRQKKYFAERAMGQLASPNYASDTGEVLDYSDEAVVLSAAPAPVFTSADAIQEVNVGQLLDAMPKCFASSNYTGGDLFSNAARVEWENKADLLSNGQKNVSNSPAMNNMPRYHATVKPWNATP